MVIVQNILNERIDSLKLRQAWKKADAFEKKTILNDIAVGLGYKPKMTTRYQELHGESLNLTDKMLKDVRELKNIRENMEEMKTSYKFPTANNLKNMDRSEILNSITKLNKLVYSNINDTSDIPEVNNKFKNIKKLYEMSDAYLYRLDSNCMDFLAWHELDTSPNGPEALCK